MQEKVNEKRLEKVKEKIDASDDVIYLVGNDLFRESAVKDIKLMVQEIEGCWKEIKSLQEDLHILMEKVNDIV